MWILVIKNVVFCGQKRRSFLKLSFIVAAYPVWSGINDDNIHNLSYSFLQETYVWYQLWNVSG